MLSSDKEGKRGYRPLRNLSPSFVCKTFALMMLAMGAIALVLTRPGQLGLDISSTLRDDMVPSRLSWGIRKAAIERSFRHRDAVLGPGLLPNQTGMGDIASAGVYDQIRAYSDWAAQPWVKTVCEIGFATGSSAIVYLESNAHLRVIAFDLMSISGRASQRALEYVQARYGAHRITIVEGESQSTLIQHQRIYGELCDLISVDGAHDERAHADFMNFRPYANPAHHVLLADDCVSRNVYQKVKAQRPGVCWSGDVWDAWRGLVDKEGVVKETATYVYGGAKKPTLEEFSGCLKGWCEGEYVLDQPGQ
jgi:hypothetical protein